MKNIHKEIRKVELLDHSCVHLQGVMFKDAPTHISSKLNGMREVLNPIRSMYTSAVQPLFSIFEESEYVLTRTHPLLREEEPSS